jgi:NAD(P)-dependent dehydrogenase (short-subunit alcohol dehydrogenase family)
MSALRSDLLNGCVIAAAGDPSVSSALQSRGARLVDTPDPDVQALVFDARQAFASGLSAALDDAWAAVLAHAGALIERCGPAKLVFIAPEPGAGPHAPAARAGLENLARTLSIEWARYAVTACTVLPGPRTTREQLGELVAYLVSPAGEYFSGCRFELC